MDISSIPLSWQCYKTKADANLAINIRFHSLTTVAINLCQVTVSVFQHFTKPKLDGAKV
jgi:hypothetical protein